MSVITLAHTDQPLTQECAEVGFTLEEPPLDRASRLA